MVVSGELVFLKGKGFPVQTGVYRNNTRTYTTDCFGSTFLQTELFYRTVVNNLKPFSPKTRGIKCR